MAKGAAIASTAFVDSGEKVRLSVPRGKYIITATCDVHLGEYTGSFSYTTHLRLGNYHQEVHGSVSSLQHNDRSVFGMQPVAITLGAIAERRANIEFWTEFQDPNVGASMASPSITAIRLDRLDFGTMALPLGEIFQEFFSEIFRNFTGRFGS